MGLKRMQGVPAHIEYIKPNFKSINQVNCKFWKNEVCYNNISTKYGETCFTRRGCMYSIPLEKGNKNVQADKNNNNYLQHKNKSMMSIDEIINNYFSGDLENTILIDKKTYKIKTNYNKIKDIFIVNILYKSRNKNYSFYFSLKLKDIIIIKENEVVFNVKLKTIIDKTSKINKELGKLIKENNTKDVIRKAIINDEKEIIKSRDSFIKYTSYIITRELLKLYN